MIRCVVDIPVGQEQGDIAVFRNGIWYIDTRVVKKRFITPH
jgi:hypothetical protein